MSSDMLKAMNEVLQVTKTIVTVIALILKMLVLHTTFHKIRVVCLKHIIKDTCLRLPRRSAYFDLLQWEILHLHVVI